MISKFKVNKFAKVDYIEPEVLKVTNDDGSESTFIMSKEAQSYIYERLKFSSSFGNKLFSISKRCWKEIVIERSVDENGEVLLDLNNEDVSFVINENNKIISITESVNIEENIKKFFEDIEKYSVNDIDKKEGLTKIILQNPSTENNGLYEPIVLIEMDFGSGSYRAFNGIRTNEGYIVLTVKPSVNVWRLPEFLEFFNAESEISMSEKLSQSLYSDFSSYINKSLKLSVREVLQTLKDAGVVVETSDDNGLVSEIPGISSKYGEMVTEFFNSFDMPFKSLLKLGYLKKSLKSNDFTVMDMLSLLSSEYTNPMLRISGYTLSSILNMLSNEECDKLIIESEIQK